MARLRHSARGAETRRVLGYVEDLLGLFMVMGSRIPEHQVSVKEPMRIDRQCDLRFVMDVQRINDPLLYFAVLVPEVLTPEHWMNSDPGAYRLDSGATGQGSGERGRHRCKSTRPMPQVAGIHIGPTHHPLLYDSSMFSMP
jgi:hypothetical protein